MTIFVSRASKTSVAIIGAGPAGLMAAEVLAQGGAGVTVYDAMPSVGRKFLLAGRGGLNLTHSEALPEFLARYGSAMPHLKSAIEAFSPAALRRWSEALGQPTFVGSSGRVFPEAFKASPLLRAWLRRLDSIGVQFALRHRWTGWQDDGRLLFATPDGPRAVDADATVLALGGASWPRLGSDGGWVETLAAKGVTISPLRPANCGFTVAWSDIFRDRFEGQPLKGAAFSFGGHVLRGEAVMTRTGIEGGAIYALSADLREAIIASGEATLHIALRPDLRCERTRRAAVGAARQTVVLELVAQGGAAFACRHRSVAGSGSCVWHAAAVAFAGSSRRIDQRRAGQIEWHRTDRARDFDGGRNLVRRT